MPVKQFNLTKGLDKQSSPSTIAENGFVEAVNIEYKDGYIKNMPIVIQTLQQNLIDPNGRKIEPILLYKWIDKVHSDQTTIQPFWVVIYYDTDQRDNIRVARSTDDMATWSDWGVLAHTDSSAIQIVDLGGSLRILNGWEDYATYIDYIKRTFWNGEVVFDGYWIEDKAYTPPHQWVSSSVDSGGYLPSGKHYFYKITGVYDGIQEGPLERDTFKTVNITGSSNATAKLVFSINKLEWNPRITHLKIYRGTNTVADETGVQYYHIKTLSTYIPEGQESGDQSNYFTGRRMASLGSVTTGLLPNQAVTNGPDHWQGGDLFWSGITITNGNWFTNSDDLSIWRDNPFQTCINKGSWQNSFQWGYGDNTGLTDHTAIGGDLYGVNYLMNYHQAHTPGQPWYQRARNAGAYVRKIRSLGNGYVTLDHEFWKDDEVLGPSEMQQHKREAQKFFGIAGNDKIAFITDASNMLYDARTLGLQYGGWYYSSPGQGDHSTALFGEQDIPNNTDGTQMGKFSHWEYTLSVPDSSLDGWQVVGQNADKTRELKKDTWYAVTATVLPYRDGSSPGQLTWSVGIATVPNTTTSYKTQHQGSYANDVIFRADVNLNNLDNDTGHQYIWVFKTSSTWGSATKKFAFATGVFDTGGYVDTDDTMGFTVHSPGVFEIKQGPIAGGYFGNDTFGVQADLNASGVSVSTNDIVGINNQDYTVINTQVVGTDEMIKIDENLDDIGSLSMTLKKDASIDVDTTDPEKINVTMYDSGLTDGAVHKFGDISTNIQYKCAKMINGRLFVGNVRLNPESDDERHPNWIMFSEFNSPDIIPITNYIAITDLGDAGNITQFAEIAGSLVVFSDNAIFRLNIPSYDPTAWSLMEATRLIGLTSPDAVLEIKGALIFANKEGLYLMDANFVPRKISTKIQDKWKMNYSDAIKIAYQPKEEGIWVSFENGDTYKVKAQGDEEIWTEILLGEHSELTVNPSIYALDYETRNLMAVRLYDEQSLVTSLDEDPQQWGYIQKPFGFLTGWVLIADPLETKIVRSITIEYDYNNWSDYDNKLLRLELYTDMRRKKKNTPNLFERAYNHETNSGMYRPRENGAIWYTDMPITTDTDNETVIHKDFLTDQNYVYADQGYGEDYNMDQTIPNDLLYDHENENNQGLWNKVSRTGRTVTFKVNKRAYACQLKVSTNWSILKDSVAIRKVFINYE